MKLTHVFLVYNCEDNTYSYSGYESVLVAVYRNEKDAVDHVETLKKSCSKSWDAKDRFYFITYHKETLK